jgi:hypothetical protein
MPHAEAPIQAPVAAPRSSPRSVGRHGSRSASAAAPCTKCSGLGGILLSRVGRWVSIAEQGEGRSAPAGGRTGEGGFGMGPCCDD